jgi:hypothetical protein
VQKNRVVESVLPLPMFCTAEVILLMFYIRPFFYKNHLLVPKSHFKRINTWPIEVLTINFYTTYHLTGHFLLLSYNSSIYLQWYTNNWCSCSWGTSPYLHLLQNYPWHCTSHTTVGHTLHSPSYSIVVLVLLLPQKTQIHNSQTRTTITKLYVQCKGL